jgi:outer membrane protein assembly factor BamB
MLAVTMGDPVDTPGAGHGAPDDEPVIWALQDDQPSEGVDSAEPPTGRSWPGARPRPPVRRPAVGSTVTALGLAGAVVGAALPWSGGRGLPAVRDLTAARSWSVWLLVLVLAALVLAVIALVRPRRGVRWSGAASALGAAGLSGWAQAGLPADQAVGVGPGLACVALVVLAVGQLLAALDRAVRPRWRWRPVGVAAVAVVIVLAAAGLGSAALVAARNVDATTAAGPLPAVTGTVPATPDTRLWGATARVYDVAGSVALVVGEVQRGAAALPGVSVRDLHTGAERWHHYERGWQVREAALTGDGGTALVVVDTGAGVDAIGFDVATGTQRWRQRLGAKLDCVSPGGDDVTPVGRCAGTLITGDGVLFLGASERDMTYLDARDGHAWPIHLGAGCRARGVGADPGGVYVLDQCVGAVSPQPLLLGERVIAYDPAGRQRWSTPLRVVRDTVAGRFGPVFVRGDVVLAEQEERYVALATATGAQLWTTTDGFEPETTVTDGTRLVWSTGIQVVTLDLHTGTQLWQRRWEFPEEADLPVLADGRLYLIRHTIGPNPYTCATHATLLTLDPASGRDRDGGSPLPDGAGNDCGPDVEDRGFVRGPLLVLLTANTITVLSGPER